MTNRRDRSAEASAWDALPAARKAGAWRLSPLRAPMASISTLTVTPRPAARIRAVLTPLPISSSA